MLKVITFILRPAGKNCGELEAENSTLGWKLLLAGNSRLEILRWQLSAGNSLTATLGWLLATDNSRLVTVNWQLANLGWQL